MTSRLWNVALAAALALATGVTANGVAAETPIPDPGMLHDDDFRPDFDSICGAGQKLSKGCDAIRARQILDAAETPWRAMGRINFASIQIRSHCTGTLVSERVVLTASHCLYNFNRRSWVPPQSITFVAGYQRGTSVAVSEAERFILDPVQDSTSRDFRANFAQDWALVVLKDPIGTQTGVLELAQDGTALDQTALTLAGYAGLRPHVLSLANDCGGASHGSAVPVLLTRCSAMSGDSGAALLVEGDGAPRVAGVFVGAYSSASDAVSVVIPAARFAAALKAVEAEMR